MFNKNTSGIVHCQKDFDNIPDSYEGRIEIKDTTEYVSINKSFNNAYIIVSGNATIKSVSGNATIESVYNNATIESVYDNATIKYVSDNATIKSVSGNATILLMTGLASIVLLYSAKKIVAKGMNLIRQIGTDKIDIEKGKDVTFIQIKKTIEKTPTFEMFKTLYPVKTKGKKVLMYKAVHKIDGRYFSDYVKDYEYTIGEVKTEKCASKESGSCASGLHLSHLVWAVLCGKGWSDLAILECETDTKDIVVSSDSDGKLRTSKLKVIRELNQNEY